MKGDCRNGEKGEDYDVDKQGGGDAFGVVCGGLLVREVQEVGEVCECCGDEDEGLEV